MLVFLRYGVIVGIFIALCSSSNGSPIKKHVKKSRRPHVRGRVDTKKDSVRPDILGAVLNPDKLDKMEERELSQLQDFNKEYINNDMASETSLLANQGIDDDSALRISNMAALPGESSASLTSPVTEVSSKQKIGDKSAETSDFQKTGTTGYNPDEYMFDANSWPEYRIKDSDYTNRNFKVSEDNEGGLGPGMEGPYNDGNAGFPAQQAQLVSDQPKDSEKEAPSLPSHLETSTLPDEGSTPESGKDQLIDNKMDKGGDSKDTPKSPEQNNSSQQTEKELANGHNMSKGDETKEKPSHRAEKEQGKDNKSSKGGETKEPKKEKADNEHKDKESGHVITTGANGDLGQLLFPSPIGNNKKPASGTGEVTPHGNEDSAAAARLKEVLMNKGSDSSRTGSQIGGSEPPPSGEQLEIRPPAHGDEKPETSPSPQGHRKPDETTLPVEMSPVLKPKPEQTKSTSDKGKEASSDSKGENTDNSTTAQDIEKALANAKENSTLGKFAEFLKAKGITLTINKNKPKESSDKGEEKEEKQGPNDTTGKPATGGANSVEAQRLGPSVADTQGPGPNVQETQGHGPSAADTQAGPNAPEMEGPGPSAADTQVGPNAAEMQVPGASAPEMQGLGSNSMQEPGQSQSDMPQGAQMGIGMSTSEEVMKFQNDVAIPEEYQQGAIYLRHTRPHRPR
ncbi:paralemmin-3 isoform X1 [Nematostella vectensis]|uniref:paralemmin-3 isoform X1 n=2 Tax=Nematostella vectensis TaxID=45351 RepID=UPI0020779408|nr:paralemmin-3 isoform X1 [Nematostella vectensis]